MVTAFLIVSGASLLAVALLMGITAWVGHRLGKVSVVDTAWGLGFVLVALVAALTGCLLGEGNAVRRWVLLGLVGVWGLRLAWHMHRRNHGQPEDKRYAEMLGDAPFSVALRRVFFTQGISLWFVSLPVQVAAVAGDGLFWVAVAGIALWLIGATFETVGDAQLAAYKRDPDRGPVMDRGLWAWTRHPNYFGDACVWWGIFLVAASAWPGVLTVLSPVAMTYFLVWATGAKLLERTMMRRPGYPEYAARTSMFVPWPPKRQH
ncbi:DUF1295 domain-containing protein [Nocardioides sp. AE5]|uniref:DUF1295 domain-containing protein n=1 Tax=Nocardioides sp. AE5 TaxID=2962573 RepID=UPI002880C3A4|nr:DUF1295 domain-containing protein [Nocardioides sp. AE5]MDT0200431.1 DUF1295 domain-containing protein [Nocardioides sp. AE5]